MQKLQIISLINPLTKLFLPVTETPSLLELIQWKNGGVTIFIVLLIMLVRMMMYTILIRLIIDARISGDSHANEALIHIATQNANVLIDNGANKSLSHPTSVFSTNLPNFFNKTYFVIINNSVVKDKQIATLP